VSRAQVWEGDLPLATVGYKQIKSVDKSTLCAIYKTGVNKMTKKICSKCGQEKERTEYAQNKQMKDGLNPRCRECIKIYTTSDVVKDRQKAYAKTESGKAAAKRSQTKRMERMKRILSKNAPGRIVSGIAMDLLNRGELRQAWDLMDDDARNDALTTWTAIAEAILS